MKKQIALIVAAAENGVIGRDDKLPWELTDDLKKFKEITTGGTLIMGRTTHEEIGKPLPERQNVVLSRVLDYQSPGCDIAKDLDEALEKAVREKVFIIGGESIYKKALEQKLVDKMYLTRVHASPEGDAFFDFDKKNWKVISQDYHEANSENQYPFTFCVLERVK